MSGGRIRPGGKGIVARAMERVTAKAPWVQRYGSRMRCDHCGTEVDLTRRVAGALRAELSFRQFHLLCTKAHG
jgi:hypothetical protein